jgi:predicted N-formylglutamate amidohydrolase
MLRSATTDGLLAPDEPSAAIPFNSGAAGRALLVCDHASAVIPRALLGLGLPIEALTRHIAVDIGAAALTKSLAVRLSTPALLAGYSRLVVDCNRAPDAPDAFTVDGDGHRVIGNEQLDAAARQARLTAIHEPYHACLGDTLESVESRGAVAVIAIHSFTPVLRRRARPWVAGVLYGDDRRLAGPLLSALRAAQLGGIGDNEPYSGRVPGAYTVHRHAAARGRLHVSLEIRQDELFTPAGIQRWAEALAAALRPTLQAAGVLP